MLFVMLLLTLFDVYRTLPSSCRRYLLSGHSATFISPVDRLNVAVDIFVVRLQKNK